MKPASPAIPLLVVDDPAACRDFWSNHLGFITVAEAMADDQLDFVLLHGPDSPGGGPTILEYQRRAGLPEALRDLLPPRSAALVYIWVMDLAAVRVRLEDSAPAAIAGHRRAPYGADELFVSDPSGHIFIFGERIPS